ncbi:MAG: hypothetical protein CMH55_03485 [Myxococcales bacterium]|nr:hypothetical protein [Myxococcales bacterium]
MVPRAPDDFVPGSFRNWSPSSDDNGGSTQPPPPPPQAVEGCGCQGGPGAAGLFGLLAFLWARRRRAW